MEKDPPCSGESKPFKTVISVEVPKGYVDDVPDYKGKSFEVKVKKQSVFSQITSSYTYGWNIIISVINSIYYCEFKVTEPSHYRILEPSGHHYKEFVIGVNNEINKKLCFSMELDCSDKKPNEQPVTKNSD